MEIPVQAQRLKQLANPLQESRNVTRSELIVAKSVNPHCQEKPLLKVMCPYHKPTQVDEERILRPAEEALLRNSAK